MSSISKRLRFVRESLGIGQADASSKFGIPASTYRKYESGPSEPGSDALAGIARTGINVNWLLTGDGAMLLSDIKPQSTSGALDSTRLQLAIETVEEGLTATKTTMAAAKKSELVLAVYELLEEPGVSKERVLKLVKFAA